MSRLFIITGTSSGIGRAMAEKMIQENEVVGISRHQAFEHKDYTHFNWDLFEFSEDHAQQLSKVAQKYSEVYLINNAGTIGSIKPAFQLSQKDIEYAMKINYTIPAFLMSLMHQALGDRLKLIINIGSGASKHSIDAWSTYCSSKSALLMHARCFQEELLKRGFNTKILDVAPGVVNTPMQEKIRSVDQNVFLESEKFHQLYENNQLVSTQEVAEKLSEVIEHPEQYDDLAIEL